MNYSKHDAKAHARETMRGIWAAALNPFQADGSFDEAGLRRNIRHWIDDLQIQLDGVDDNAEKTIATLTFSGVSKTSRFDQGEPFSESWRLERAQGDNQPWLIAGIRQN